MLDYTLKGNYSYQMNQTSTSLSRPTELVAFLSALNIFLSITATLGNLLILIALQKESSLYPPTKLLFRCLAVTDLCTGLVSQPLFAVSLIFDITEVNKNILKNISRGIYVSSYIFCGISILTSTALSVDRLLALLLRLRYRQIATLRRARVFIFCSWLICVLCGLVYLSDRRFSLIVVSIISILSVAISVLSYTKIYLTLRQRHHAQVQDHVHQRQLNRKGIPLKIARYRKTVSSILWIQLALLACYVPFCVMSILRASRRKYYMAWLATVTQVYLNSFVNPIMYCWKIRSIRQAVRNTTRQFRCTCL